MVDRNLGRCMISAMADIFRVPKLFRHNLRCYNFKNQRYMKGDERIRPRNRITNFLDRNKPNTLSTLQVGSDTQAESTSATQDIDP